MAQFSVVVRDRDTKFLSGRESQKVEKRWLKPFHYSTCITAPRRSNVQK